MPTVVVMRCEKRDGVRGEDVEALGAVEAVGTFVVK